ncbi:hypothetical protein [Roseovarius sp. Pro17]|uniref:hypothetical protein n=1 Tax=Roseovarius sp. Pro17 TaxID=3108175 RepID=UPI002D770ECC|nr:hypothetical protein [Roseovarius sp. Pro17]
MDRTERFRRLTSGLLSYVAMYALAAAAGILSQNVDGIGLRIGAMFGVAGFALMALTLAGLTMREGALIAGDFVASGIGLWMLRILVLAVLAGMILSIHMTMMSAIRAYFWTPPL